MAKRHLMVTLAYVLATLCLVPPAYVVWAIITVPPQVFGGPTAFSWYFLVSLFLPFVSLGLYTYAQRQRSLFEEKVQKTDRGGTKSKRTVVLIIVGVLIAYALYWFYVTLPSIVPMPLSPIWWVLGLLFVLVCLALAIPEIRELREDKEGTYRPHYVGDHPPPERKPETGVGSEAWEANRLREIRELREKERKKTSEST